MNKLQNKIIIKKITKWAAIIFFGFLLIQLLRLIFNLLFFGGQNPL